MTKTINHYKERSLFENSTKVDGCRQRICPCGMLINCRQYNNKGRKYINPLELNIELHEWYQTYFRIIYEHYDSFGNGWYSCPA